MEMRIDVKGFSADGKLLFHQIYESYDWYDGVVAIIDSSEFRRFYKIRSAIVEEYEWRDGVQTILKRVSMDYDEAGEFLRDVEDDSITGR